MIGIRKMDNRGMMTVEAACIVPIILMIIVILLLWLRHQVMVELVKIMFQKSIKSCFN